MSVNNILPNSPSRLRSVSVRDSLSLQSLCIHTEASLMPLSTFSLQLFLPYLCIYLRSSYPVSACPHPRARQAQVLSSFVAEGVMWIEKNPTSDTLHYNL